MKKPQGITEEARHQNVYFGKYVQFSENKVGDMSIDLNPMSAIETELLQFS